MDRAPWQQPVEQWRADFPILKTRVRGKPLVYLDNGATTQKPQTVIDAEREFYSEYNSNIHRGVHTLSQKATEAYEAARETVRRYINARAVEEIVFVRGTTEAINLVAASYGRRLQSGDEIVITEMEHHSNIVPWQLLCEHTGALLKVAPINDAGELRFDEFEKLLSERVKIVSVVQVSNSLGTVNPVSRIVASAHRAGAVVLVDGAQAVAHMPVDVQALDADFYAFSSHKLYGPTGIGVLYGKAGLLDSMPPYQGGGDMIRRVSFAKTEYNTLPYKFEAGTPNVAAGIGFKAALDYVSEIGLPAIAAHEADLLRYATGRVSEIPGLRIIGTAADKAEILSFVMEHAHPHDIGTILDHEGIAIRAGHHCTMPLMERYQVPATARASFALYNTREEVDAFIAGLFKVREILS